MQRYEGRKEKEGKEKEVGGKGQGRTKEKSNRTAECQEKRGSLTDTRLSSRKKRKRTHASE